MTDSKAFILEHWQQIEKYVIPDSKKFLLNLVNNNLCLPGTATGISLKNFDWTQTNDKAVFIIKLDEYKNRAGYKSDPELYNAACLTPATFSNIRNMGDKNNNYVPQKGTLLCLMLALHLSVDEANELLEICGYTLSDKVLADKLIAWCLEIGIYDIQAIEETIIEKLSKRYLMPRHEGYKDKKS